MRSQLPPLPAIKAFEAAARLGNFTAAAAELGMTQSAVSYQIKVLEDRVGTPLFLRHARGVELTPRGLRFSRQVTEGLDLLRDAFAAARGEGEETLAITVIATIAVTILAQRLGRFQIANPSIAVRVEVGQAVIDLAAGEFDVAIRSGRGNWPGMKCDMLMPARFSPMLSPALAASIGGVNEPADLLKLPIIEPRDPWWQTWFSAAGVATGDFLTRRGLHLSSQILEANVAIAGHGVGMLTPAFYRDSVAQNLLIQPFDLIASDGSAYWLVCREQQRNSRKIKLFRDWLLAEMEDYR